MIDLAIQVKLAAEQMDPEHAKVQKQRTKVMVCILSLPVIPLGVYQAKLGAYYAHEDKEPTGLKGFFYVCFPTIIMTLLAIGLCVACIRLIMRMNKFFPRNLKDEGCRIKTISLVFTISYITRAVLSLVLPVAEHFGKISELASWLTFEVCYNFWDVVPLTLIMMYHYKCFPTGSSDDAEGETERTEYMTTVSDTTRTESTYSLRPSTASNYSGEYERFAKTEVIPNDDDKRTLLLVNSSYREIEQSNNTNTLSAT